MAVQFPESALRHTIVQGQYDNQISTDVAAPKRNELFRARRRLDPAALTGQVHRDIHGFKMYRVLHHLLEERHHPEQRTRRPSPKDSQQQKRMTKVKKGAEASEKPNKKRKYDPNGTGTAKSNTSGLDRGDSERTTIPEELSNGRSPKTTSSSEEGLESSVHSTKSVRRSGRKGAGRNKRLEE